MRKIVTIYSEEQPVNGIVSSLAYLGAKSDDVEVVNWQPNAKPAYDMFDEMKPDLIVCGSSNAPNIKKPLKEFGCKLVICGGMPPHELQPDLLLFSGEVPEMVKKHSPFPFVSFEPAANVSKFRGGKFDKDKESDVLYFASSQGGLKHEADILSVMAGMNIKFKIIGYRRPLLNYIGVTTVEETADFFASAKVVIDIANNTKYDVAAQKGFCLSTVPGMYPHIEEFDWEKWKNTTEELIGDDGKRKSLAKKAHTEVMVNHTYFHRLGNMFDKLGWEDGKKESLKVLEEIVLND